jgi:hypothetical protein
VKSPGNVRIRANEYCPDHRPVGRSKECYRESNSSPPGRPIRQRKAQRQTSIGRIPATNLGGHEETLGRTEEEERMSEPLSRWKSGLSRIRVALFRC